ncbi:MAG: transcription factor S [Methermicoccaceae archaeon]
MQFCPKCKSIMVPSGAVLKCRKCGFEMEGDKEGDEKLVFTTKIKARDITVLEHEEAAGLPTTRAHCQECGNNTAYWWLRQMRSADESETRFFRCTKCGYTWREYD